MSVVRKKAARQGTYNADGSNRQSITYTVTIRDFRSTTGDVFHQTVRSQPGVPRFGDPNPDDPTTTCVRQTVAETDSRLVYEVTCEFTPRKRNSKPDIDKPPWLQRMTKRTSTQRIEEFATRDLEGKLFTNSANLPFVPSPVVTRRLTALHISKNVLDFDLKKTAAFLDATNDAPWGEFPPYTWLLDDVSTEQAWYQEQVYDKVSWVFLLKYDEKAEEDGNISFRWHPFHILDAGTHQVKDRGFFSLSEIEYIPCKDGLGNEASDPRLLDGTGVQAPDGAEPHFIDFRTVKLAKFDDLELGSPKLNDL